MKRKKTKCNLPVTRIDSKHAWYYACIDTNNVVHVVMFSYDTPIFVVSNAANTQDAKLHVILNESAYEYSRTTSKQISQWISHLHLFTSWGCDLPWSFRYVLDAYKRCKIPNQAVLDSVEYDIVPEYTLKNLCNVFALANLPARELWQMR